jgi:hypothetical protein
MIHISINFGGTDFVSFNGYVTDVKTASIIQTLAFSVLKTS